MPKNLKNKLKTNSKATLVKNKKQQSLVKNKKNTNQKISKKSPSNLSEEKTLGKKKTDTKTKERKNIQTKKINKKNKILSKKADKNLSSKTKKTDIKQAKNNKKINNKRITVKTLQNITSKKLPEKKNEEKKPEISKKKLTNEKQITSQKTIKQPFKIGVYAVYPSHGVGKIIDIEETKILDQNFSCYIMYFEKEKLSIKIPVSNAEKVGLRPLVSKEEMDEVFVTLRSGIKKLKGMWSRRAQEYETKINSGDIMLLSEVLRDLARDIDDSERSYSERVIYETAVYRLASEYSAIYGVSFEEAKEKIILTAKDKLSLDGKIPQKDDFDAFDDFDRKDRDEEDEEEEEEEEDEDDEDDDDYDDDRPRKKGRK
jgi:CarD family transcriptional regulator